MVMTRACNAHCIALYVCIHMQLLGLHARHANRNIYVTYRTFHSVFAETFAVCSFHSLYGRSINSENLICENLQLGIFYC